MFLGYLQFHCILNSKTLMSKTPPSLWDQHFSEAMASADDCLLPHQSSLQNDFGMPEAWTRISKVRSLDEGPQFEFKFWPILTPFSLYSSTMTDPPPPLKLYIMFSNVPIEA